MALLTALRWSFCAHIALASVQTLVAARTTRDVHALILATLELAAIAAFLLPALERAAGVVLIGIFGVAAVACALDGELSLRFVYYGVTTAYLVAASHPSRAVAPRASGGQPIGSA